MKIAIITGASSGLGQEFATQISGVFPHIEKIWLIARREEKLADTAKTLSIPAEPVALDLCSEEGISLLSEKLDSEKPEVALLINCAGCGYLGDVDSTDPKLFIRSIDLNVRALTEVTCAVLPYIKAGGRIINISSIASFCPNARMTVYSATKSYVTDFSLGLREELKTRAINVTAICPGPMATEFLDVGHIKGNSQMFNTLPYSDPKKVVRGALLASKNGQAVWTPKLFFKFYRFLAKIIPHTLLVKFVKT